MKTIEKTPIENGDWYMFFIYTYKIHVAPQNPRGALVLYSNTVHVYSRPGGTSGHSLLYRTRTETSA